MEIRFSILFLTFWNKKNFVLNHDRVLWFERSNRQVLEKMTTGIVLTKKNLRGLVLYPYIIEEFEETVNQEHLELTLLHSSKGIAASLPVFPKIQATIWFELELLFYDCDNFWLIRLSIICLSFLNICLHYSILTTFDIENHKTSSSDVT